SRSWLGEQRLGVETLRGVEVELHLLGKGRGTDHIHKRRVLRRPGAIVHLEVGPLSMQSPGHTEDRCHADAAGQQQMSLGGRLQREQVARCANSELVANLYRLVQGPRSPSRARLIEYADDITMGFGGVVA